MQDVTVIKQFLSARSGGLIGSFVSLLHCHETSVTAKFQAQSYAQLRPVYPCAILNKEIQDGTALKFCSLKCEHIIQRASDKKV